MRTKIVAGNWKMNKNLQESHNLTLDILSKLNANSATRVIIAPTFTNLHAVANQTKNTKVEVAAQNLHQADNGAFTGEISADMIKSVGVNIVILGHSERRAYFGETDELLTQKVNAALTNDLEIIFCFGEELKDRKSGKHFEVVENQLKNGIFHIEAAAWKSVVLAYEPVWAVGTGQVVERQRNEVRTK